MKSYSAQMVKWLTALCLGICALNYFGGDFPFSKVALAADTRPSSYQGAAFVPAYPYCPPRGRISTPIPIESDIQYCIYKIFAGDTLGMIAKKYSTTPNALMLANQEVQVPGQKKITNVDFIRDGTVILIPNVLFSISAPAQEDMPLPTPSTTPESALTLPVSEEPFEPSNVQAPPPSVDEKISKALEDLKDRQNSIEAGQKVLQTDVQKQSKQIDEFIDIQQKQIKQLERQGEDIAALKRVQEQQTKDIAALRNESEKKLSTKYFEKVVALAFVAALTLAIIGALLFKVFVSHLPTPVPTVETERPAIQPVAPPAEPIEDSSRTDVKIATHYLSTPKQEDVILTTSTASFYAAVLADGASSYRFNGGEISGGGRQAAEIAAQTATTYLTSHILPSMGIQEIMAILNDCFLAANIELEKHNASTDTPGGTTLIIALLCQGGNGSWYWFYGNLGNGILELLHSEQLLSGWPIYTPLMSKQTNGVTTITMPGYATKGFRSSVGCRPHIPGDILIVGSDGLEHLDTVTKKCDRLYFYNYLWKQICNDRSLLDMSLKSMQNGRADTQWVNALELDDTTIGIIWA